MWVLDPYRRKYSLTLLWVRKTYFWQQWRPVHTPRCPQDQTAGPVCHTQRDSKTVRPAGPGGTWASWSRETRFEPGRPSWSARTCCRQSLSDSLTSTRSPGHSLCKKDDNNLLSCHVMAPSCVRWLNNGLRMNSFRICHTRCSRNPCCRIHFIFDLYWSCWLSRDCNRDRNYDNRTPSFRAVCWDTKTGYISISMSTNISLSMEAK